LQQWLRCSVRAQNFYRSCFEADRKRTAKSNYLN
jgi:hypothetical protein